MQDEIERERRTDLTLRIGYLETHFAKLVGKIDGVVLSLNAFMKLIYLCLILIGSGILWYANDREAQLKALQTDFRALQKHNEDLHVGK